MVPRLVLGPVGTMAGITVTALGRAGVTIGIAIAGGGTATAFAVRAIASKRPGVFTPGLFRILTDKGERPIAAIVAAL